MPVFRIVSIALVGLLLVSFLFGLLRGWKKSLVRVGIVVGCIILSILLTNLFSNLIIDKYVNGLVLSLFGFSVDFEAIAVEMIGDGSFISDLLAEGSTTNKLATALINVVINLLVFIVVFLILYILTLIIYSIVAIVINVRKKYDENTKPLKAWERFVGAGIGVFGMLLICMVLFTPIFGFMNVCNGFLKTDNKKTASAINYQSYMSAGLYNNSNNGLDKVESYIEEYANLKKAYDSSFAGIVFKYTGIDFIGRTTFDNLTTVKIQGLKFDFTSECVVIVKAYNKYKTTFRENEFDITNNDCVESVSELFAYTEESKVLESYVVEIVPNFSQKWSNGEKYFGVEFPIKGDFKDMSLKLINIFNTNSFYQINENVNVVFNIIKIANDNNVIKDIRNGVAIEEILSQNTNFVYDEIMAMTESARFKNELPKVMHSIVEIAYEKLVGDSEGKLTESSVDSNDIVWHSEATLLQKISNNIFKVMYETKQNGAAEVLKNNLSEIGAAVDCARQSQVISEPFKKLIIDYVNSEKFNLSQTVKDYINDIIEEKWNDNEFSFEDSFNTLEETAKIAENINNADLTKVKEELKNLISDSDSKEQLKQALQNGLIEELTGKNDTNTKILNELLTSFVSIDSNQNTKEEVEKAVASGNEIYGLVKALDSQDKTYEFAGETESEQTTNAKNMMETIAASDVVMNVANDESSEISKAIEELNIDKTIVQNGIKDSNISDEKKDILKKLFNIV